MEKIVKIDGKELRMVANGATPRVYRSLFGRDVFSDVQNAIDGDSLKDISAIEQLAYTLAKQGGSVTDMTIDEWLGSMDDPMAIINIAGDIFSLWVGNRATLSTSKKKNGQSTAK